MTKLEELASRITQGKWTKEYDNDTGPSDESFAQWFVAGPAQVHYDNRDEERAKADSDAIILVPQLLQCAILLRELRRLRVRERLSMLDIEKEYWDKAKSLLAEIERE